MSGILLAWYVYHNSPRSTLVRFLCLAHQCNLSSIKWHTRPSVSFGLYLVTESHMSSTLIRYFNNRLPRKGFFFFFFFLQWARILLMKTNIKVWKVCHCPVGWMALKLNTHDNDNVVILLSLYWYALDKAKKKKRSVSRTRAHKYVAAI